MVVRVTTALSVAVEVSCWWLVTTGIWLLTLSSINSAELAAALACGLACGLTARAGRHAMDASWQMSPGWLRWLGPLPLAVLADCGRLLVLALRAPGSEARTGHFLRMRTAAHREAAAGVGHHAVATVLLSATPGTLVVDEDPAGDALVVHALVSGRPDLEEVVAR